MKKIKYILGLFLSLVLFITVIPNNVKAGNGTTSLRVAVSGSGSVILKDGYSEYVLGINDVFKANCTDDTKVAFSVMADEDSYIESISINSDTVRGLGVSNNIKTYEFDRKISEDYDIRIVFNKKADVKEQVKEDTSSNDKETEVQNPQNQQQQGGNEQKEEKKDDEEKTEESNSETDKELKEEDVISQYNSGIKSTVELKEYRKKLAIEKDLLSNVDSDFFLTEEYLSDKSSAFIMDEGIVALVNSLNTEELNALGDNLKTRLALTRSSTVTNSGSVSVSYKGFTHTAPFLSVGGRQAFCVTFGRVDPSSGVVATNPREANNSSLKKVLYYGYNGPGTGSISSQWSSNQNLLMIATTQAASHANGQKSYSLGKDFYGYVQGLPEPPSGFQVFIVSTGGVTQDLAYWELQQNGAFQLRKESANPDYTNNNDAYSLQGAEYGVYSNSNATGLVGTLVTGANGWSQEITLGAGTYYVKELRAPKGYCLDSTIYTVNVSGGSKTTATYTDDPFYDPIPILLRKVDAGTGTNTPVQGASLANAEFTIKYFGGDYADGINPEVNGIRPTRTWVLKTDEDGYTSLSDVDKVAGDPFYLSPAGVPTIPLGTITIQETKAPVGYHVNDSIFVRKIAPNSNLSGVVQYNEPIVQERSLEVAIEKVQSGTTAKLPGTVFRHVSPDGTSAEYTTNSQGLIVLKGLKQGVHTIQEVSAPDGYVVNPNEFRFEVDANNHISALNNNPALGLNFSLVNGNGILSVSDDVAPFSLKVIKVNDKGATLEGAEFTLYSDRNCTVKVGKVVSNANGELLFNNLKINTDYFLKETKAPQGYRIPVDLMGKVPVYTIRAEAEPINGVFNFEVNGAKYDVGSTTGDIHLEGGKNDRVINMKVVNYITMKLPVTGSWLMIPLFVVGVGLMLSSFILRKKNRG